MSDRTRASKPLLAVRLTLGLVTLAALTPRAALAVPSYPRAIQSDLQLAYQPPCSICHQFGKTGNGTPIEPFALSLRARGLSGSKTTLTTSLDTDKSDGVDSDGDGISDVDELVAGTDPNSAGNDCIIPAGTTGLTAEQCTPGTQASPSLGCSLTSAPRSGGLGALSGAVALALAVALRRRRGRVGPA